MALDNTPQPKPERMKIIAEDAERVTILDYFEGQPVHFYMNKATREFYINADDMAKIMGYADQHELLSQDAALDILSEHHKQNPDKPFLENL